MPDYSDIRVERPSTDVARIMFARAESNNTSRPEGLAELCTAMDELTADRSVKAIVLAADGKHFSAGADISFLDAVTGMTPEQIKGQVYAHFQGAAKRIWHCPKPTIAVVNGAAVSVGCELALACDYRIADKEASFMEVWVKFGIMPPLGGLFLLPRIIGLGRAMDMCLRGIAMPAEEALRAGLVSEVLEPAELQQRGLSLAAELAALPRSAYAAIKESIHHGLASNMDSEWAANLHKQAVLLSSDDFREALSASKEKRAPDFSQV